LLTSDERDRLREAIRRAGGYDRVHAATDIPVSTLKKMVGEASDPGFSRTARVARAIGLGLEELAFGDAPGSSKSGMSEFGHIPLYDVEVSAGDGRTGTLERPVGTLAFREDYLRRFSDRSKLAVLLVRGDSMVPELQDGDHLLIDQSERHAAEGLCVVRWGDLLMAKRIVRTSASGMRLVSSNPIYPPIEIDRDAEGDNFAIIGRAVWVGRKL